MTASGVRRSCEIDASSVLRRLSRSASHTGGFGHFGETGTFQCKPDLSRESLQQVALLRQQTRGADWSAARPARRACVALSPSGR